MQQIADQTDSQFIDYVIGFQLDDVSDFSYPYILVQEHKIDTPSHSQIMTIFESEELSGYANEKIDEYSELITNASIQDPFMDKQRNIIFMNLEIDVQDIGKVKGLMAMFLGRESITQLNFYTVESEYSENLSTFNQIIDSFKYDQGYEYNEEEAKINDSSSIFEGVIEKGVIGGIFGGLVALALWLFLKLKKKGEKKART